MFVLFEILIQIALVAIAVSVTVYVLAVSLLGQALEKASIEEAEIKEKRRTEIQKSIEELNKELKNVKETSEIKKLRRKLDKHVKKLHILEKEIRKVQDSPQLLTVKGAVLFPCLFFIIALLLSSSRIYLQPFLVNIVMWEEVAGIIIIVLCIVIGFSRIIGTLKVIEVIAIISQKTVYKQTMEAFSAALEMHENKNRPNLIIDSVKPEAPFHFGKNTTADITVRMSLAQGDVARKPEIWLLVPEGFSIIGESSKRLENYDRLCQYFCVNGKGFNSN